MKDLLNKIVELFSKIIFQINKFIKIMLPYDIVNNPNNALIFKRFILFALLLFVLQGFIVSIAVFIVVKSGGETVTLPDVQDKDIFEAFNVLEKEDINLNVQTHYFKNYPIGTIVSQEPKGGMKIKKGRTVYLVVNAPERVTVIMPDVTGMNYIDAIEIISNEVISRLPNVHILPNMELKEEMYENDIVLSQIPSPDEIVGEASEIVLTVNNKN